MEKSEFQTAINWNKLFKVAEKIALYICLIAVVIINIIKMFGLNLPKDIDLPMTMSLISLALILIFQKIDKILIKDKSFIASKNFSYGLDNILKYNQTIKSLDIFAYTTRTYNRSIRDIIAEKNITIEKVRLLVYKPQKPAYTSQFAAVDQMIPLWQQLQQSGKIHSLDIRYFEYAPTCYFALIDGKYYHFGFLKPEWKNVGYELITSFSSSNVITSESESLKEVFIDIFNTYYSDPKYSRV